MKRKKWSEQEEQSLLRKYSELQSSGTLSKLKTREKKFRPIAEHVNTTHHGTDPATFPFRWSWRDVSIKVQNMRHQYLCVKQKIRLSPHSPDFNWDDGDNHWQNFLAYKSVFGDIDLDSRSKRPINEDDDSAEAEDEIEAEDRARRIRSEREAMEIGAEDRARRRRLEEGREEEEMEWRERALALQVEHEKAVMRIHVEACQCQMQVLAAIARLVCQFFGGGVGGDGLGGVLAPPVMENLEHHGGAPELGESGKPDENSPSEFL